MAMTASFHDVRFPTGISRGATGGPERRTEIVALGSGREERNTRWALSRRRYNVGYGIRSIDEIHQVVDFFEARKGRLYAFRWKDHADYKSCLPALAIAATDQLLGLGDGTRADFQLVKLYGDAASSYQRTITRPVAGSLVVAVDGAVMTSGVDFTLDDTTGLVSFFPASVPGAGSQVSAGFEFDVPARFDSDILEISLAAFDAGQILDIPVVEVHP